MGSVRHINIAIIIIIKCELQAGLGLCVELYDYFIEANRNPDPEKRMLKLKRLLHTLPEHHYETFKHLAEHLSTVAAHGLANKVSMLQDGQYSIM